MYPEVLNLKTQKEKILELQDLTSSALYKDILEFQNIKNPSILNQLLKLLALNIGQEISLNTLGGKLGMDSRTIERYIDLLEKSYVIFRLPPFYSNKQKEMSKMHKIYFYDLGIRNALLENFTSLPGRTDKGALWENWMIMEWKKNMDYSFVLGRLHFWRGKNQQEIDLIHEGNGEIKAYEIKWQKKNKNCPSLFKNLYPENIFHEVHKDNYFKFFEI